MSEPTVYKILFSSQGKMYEIYARQVSQGSLFGFIEVEELVFGERSQLVVDPGEESLRREFEGVRRTYLPMHSILRIDEVKKEGVAKVTDQPEEGNLRTFPVPFPGIDPSSSRK